MLLRQINIAAVNGTLSSRGYATLKDIQTRLKSIKNIGKITSSMKMIASTKLNRAQKAMEIGRSYGQASTMALQHLEIDSTPILGEALQAKTAEVPKMEEGQNHLVLVCSSDRGLCGAIHSSVSKIARTVAASARKATEIAVLGDKAKPQIARDARKNIRISFNGISKNVPTLLDAISVLHTLKSSAGATELNLNPSRVSIIYNRFQSVIAYQPILVPVPTVRQLKASPKIAAYEYDDEVLEHYAQFILASRLYWGLIEGYAAEMAAKRTAMENASKNAEEISLGLLMKYNRTRQSVITNELVDIITGASAL